MVSCTSSSNARAKHALHSFVPSLGRAMTARSTPHFSHARLRSGAAAAAVDNIAGLMITASPLCTTYDRDMGQVVVNTSAGYM